MHESGAILRKIEAEKHIPRATYRLQFGKDLTFQKGLAIVPYLKDLGLSDIYASPLLQAGPESTHGYDVTCCEQWHAPLGNPDDFKKLSAALSELHMGLLLDI